MMERAMSHAASTCRAVLAAVAITLLMSGDGRACDGKNYSVDAAVGQVASGGGLQVQIDRVKLLDEGPDKYTVSVKDDADLLADHVTLMQFDTVSFKTRCGLVTIGADRKSMFHNHVLTVSWSYF